MSIFFKKVIISEKTQHADRKSKNYLVQGSTVNSIYIYAVMII